jgi:chromosome segregation protein
VFEEAAGITKYKGQKKEAMRKLEATEANLLRIGDIIKEVKRQIGSLQRQAGKARRYQTLMTDLQVLDTHQSRHKLDELEAELNHCRAEIVRFEEVELETLAKIETSETSSRANAASWTQSMPGSATRARSAAVAQRDVRASQPDRIQSPARAGNSELIERYTNDIATAETEAHRAGKSDQRSGCADREDERACSKPNESNLPS